jgi:hypothetical protein
MIIKDLTTMAENLQELTALPAKDLHRVLAIAYPGMSPQQINTVVETLYKAIAQA